MNGQAPRSAGDEGGTGRRAPPITLIYPLQVGANQMALWQGNSRRKPTGGRLLSNRGKMRREIAREHIDTHVGEDRQKVVRTKGANQKVKLLSATKVNVTDPKNGKTTAATLTNVTENAANIHYVRRNIITKGAVVETSAGKARITSRPGQSGALSAVLVE